jgi:hypothetical protein
MRFAKVHLGQGRPQAGGGRNTRQETRLTFRKRLATILSASALALATPLAAQQTPPPQIAAEEVTDAQVVAFVDAILAVDEVRKEYGPKIEEAEDKAQQQALAEAANTAAAEAVDEVDSITLDSYIAIANAARESEALNKRIVARLAEVREP